MHRIHSGFTFAVPVIKGKGDALKCLLRTMDGGKQKGLLNFEDSESTLFASGVILPEEKYGHTEEMLPETFVFSTTYCGPLDWHLAELVFTCKNGLLQLFEHCSGFKIANGDIRQCLLNYLHLNSQRNAFNSRYQCITKRDAKKEKKLRIEIENYLDKAQKLNAFYGCSAVEIKKLIQRHIKTRGAEYEWAYFPARKTVYEFAVINRGGIFLVTLVLLLLGLLIRKPKYALLIMLAIGTLVFLLKGVIWLITLDEHETAKRPSDEKVRSIAATQLYPVMNEMTAAAPLKRGRLRRFFYSVVLRVANFLAPILMKVPTVSSIRWLAINNRKRLLFLPNYSNTTDFYVRDFLNGKTWQGVNFMFTNGQGFPDSKMLLQGGIKDDPEGYMNAVHAGQKETQMRYAHEPMLTADTINRNRKIRNGLFTESILAKLSSEIREREATEWLKLL